MEPMEPIMGDPVGEPTDPLTEDPLTSDAVIDDPMMNDPMPMTSDDSATCSLGMYIQADGPFTAGAARLNFTLNSTRANQRFQDALNIRDTNFPVNERRRYRVDVTVPGQQAAIAGNYQANLSIGVVDGSAAEADRAQAAGLLDDSTQVSLELNVPGVARVFFAGTQSRQRVVDFGRLTSGGQPDMPIALLIQATNSVQLQFTSANNGMLVNESHASDGHVDYRVSIRGESYSLDQPTLVTISNPGNSTGEAVVPLEFELGDVSRQRAGFYTDTLSITLRPSLTAN